MRWLEIGARTYPLRFTAQSILRVQDRTQAPFSALFDRGPAGLCALLYCALCDALPRLTLDGAADLLECALRARPAGEIADTVLLALADSGFDRRGVTRQELSRLTAAAVRAGYPAPEGLRALTLREIEARLSAHAAALSLRPGSAPAPMTDSQMKSLLQSFAGRQQNDHT